MRLKPPRAALVLSTLIFTACQAVAPIAATGPAASSAAVTEAAPSAAVSSTPIPATPIPSQTPPPPAEYFTETFDTLPPYWTFFQVEAGHLLEGPSGRDGFLVFDLVAPNQWAYAIYDGFQYSDARVETEVQFRTAGDGAAGLICRYDEKSGWYEFNVFADQSYQLLYGEWLAPGVARYTPLFKGESAAITPDSNHLTFECTGNTLAPVVNGQQLRKWPEQKFGLTKGKIGLAASTFADAPFTIAFNAASVSAP